jgi:hypothetical protein
MKKLKIHLERSKNLAMPVIINARDVLIRTKNTNKLISSTQTKQSPSCSPEMDRLQTRNCTRHIPDPNTNAHLLCNASTH